MSEQKIRSQVVVLKVFYDDNELGNVGKDDPSSWNWQLIIKEPIENGVEVLAFGPVVDYPSP